jgi:aryl-alcohol dehydrogenase-like predicted oxidoreductase
MATRNQMNRRKFVKRTLVAAAAAALVPGIATSCAKRPALMKRPFGRTGFNVTTMGLGGQASLQWTPPDVDPVKIILKAFDLGINYYDTSNLYGPSQSNFGKAFRELNLVPGEPQYNEELRKSIFLVTKTHLRFAKGNTEAPGVTNWSNGGDSNHTIFDLNRSLSLMFGDGKGNYPDGAYIDLMLIHNLNTREEVDALYEGLDNTDPSLERIGALAALRDYRDGTNLTGLNPENKRLIRHIGFSGHFDPSVNMYMIQRDKTNILDAMLVAINANDKLMFNMQHNVIPLAKAKGMGVIGMKVFADGAMYTKPSNWTRDHNDVVRSVGSAELPSKPLIRYSLTTPGVDLVIIGIGHISDKYSECQLENNIDAAQILPDGLNESERAEIEVMAAKAKDGKSNYFQREAIPLTAPGQVNVSQTADAEGRMLTVSWSTAYAGDAPMTEYEIMRDGSKIAAIPFTPQLTTDPVTWTEKLNDADAHSYIVRITDSKGRNAESVAAVIEKN